MKKILLIFLLIPIITFAQDQKVAAQFRPFIGHWTTSTKDYKTEVTITHESAYPMKKLAGDSDITTEVLFFDFLFYDKTAEKEIRIKSSLDENFTSFTAFLSPDQMPNVLFEYGDHSYKYKLKSIQENEIELISNEKPRYEIDIATKQSRIIPKEPSPIPDRIVLKRVKK